MKLFFLLSRLNGKRKRVRGGYALKKISFIIVSALYLTTAGAFYYGGAPEKTAASDENIIIQQHLQSSKLVEYKDQNIQEEFFNGQTDEISSADLRTNEDKIEDPVEEPKDVQPVTQPEEKMLTEDTIQYGDSTFVSLMQETRFQHLINVALKYDAKLYAIPDSDVFAFFKAGNIILTKSTGVTAAHPQYVEMLKEVHSGEGFLYEGVLENIDFVNRTGAKVTVEFEPYTGYAISREPDGWIVVSW
jgi:hypothetical protein